MLPRVKPAILRMFTGPDIEVDKIRAAETVYCHPRTACRLLQEFHEDGILRIKGWVRSKGRPYPIYILADGKKDCPPLKKKKYVPSPEARKRAYAKAKLLRWMKKSGIISAWECNKYGKNSKPSKDSSGSNTSR